MEKTGMEKTGMEKTEADKTGAGKMDVKVIGDENTVVGFRLAGVCGYSVKDKAEAEEAFEKCKGSGVVVVTERIAEMIRATLSEERFFPLVIEIPDREGPIDREDQLRILMRQAIGVDMKKEEGK